MKKKRNGFMLAELIITSTIVVTSMIALYSSFNRIYSLYKAKNNYYYVDGVYATKEIANTIVQNDFNKFIIKNFDAERNMFLIKDGECKVDATMHQKCEAIKKLYNIKNMVFAEYNKCNLNIQKCTTIDNNNRTEQQINDTKALKVTNQTFKDYVDYVIDYYNIEDENNEYNYVILTEIEEKGQLYYSNLRIR